MTCCCENKTKDLKKMKKVCSKALKTLGKKNFALIAHGNSFPAIEGRNTGFGTPNSQAGKNLMDFASGMFNAIQLGPQGKTKACDSSPYTGTIFSTNPLFIDLEQLTTKEWGNILSEETFNRICNENPNKGINKTSYSYICKAQEEALQEAFVNFKEWNNKKLNKEFEKFKTENDFWLSKDALYEALVVENNNDYWPLWDNKTDRNLFNPKNDEDKKASFLREKELRLKYADLINYYSFCQFIASKQNEQTKKYALKHNLKLIADRQVAFSDRDSWAYQSLFLEGWMLGCPPDYFSEDGQAWGFPVVDPKKMFNEDGSLGEAGILMKQLYKKMFKENPGGVRIDHIVGLIDPWVYKAGKKPMPEEGAGRLYSSPEHPELAQYAIATMDDLNLELGSDKEERVKSLTKEQIKETIEMLEEMREERFGRGAQISLDVSDLLLHINRLIYERNHPAHYPEPETLYQKISHFIEEHIDEELSLERLSNEFFVSKYHISHIFKDNLGLSVHQYITKKRLALCHQALMGDATVIEVYRSFGFGDYSSFFRAFKKEYGISPSKLKKQG